MNRWWWPFSKTEWCDETVNFNGADHTHVCDEALDELIHYQHKCACGFRWAA